jgi:hypothetical protein
VTVTAPPLLITTQPVNLTVRQGSNATFSVTASACGPIRYQWYFNMTNVLTGQTNAALTITNVQAANVGGYGVVVSNATHVVVSDEASLELLVSPTITPGSMSKVGNTVTFTLDTQPGVTYIVEYKDDLNAVNWTVLTTITGDGAVHTVADSTATSPQRYYRIRVQ